MYKSRLSKDEIWQIYWLRLMGKSPKEIARRFDISEPYVYNVFKKKAYQVAYAKATNLMPWNYGPYL